MTFPPTIAFTTFANKQDNQPRSYAYPWPKFADLMTKHKTRLEKDGVLFSPTLYKPGATRGIEGVECVTCFVADIDDGTSPAALRSRWVNAKGEPLTYCLYSSFSSSAEKPKCRVVFVLAEPVPAADWGAIWAKLNVALLDGHCDRACKDPCRIYYAPSCPPDKLAEAFADQRDGALLCPSDYPEVSDADDAAASMRWVAKRENYTPPPAGSGKPGEDYDNRADPAEVLGYLVGDGGRIIGDKGGKFLLQRPGKMGRDFSATYGYNGMHFFCFSSSWPPFEPNRHYGPFQIFALLQCGGDFSEAARQLGARGFGEQQTPLGGGSRPSRATANGGSNAGPFSEKNPITAPEFAGKPRSLSPDLPPVVPFTYDLLPSRFAAYVQDCAERIGCPPDYIAAPLIVGAASVIGSTMYICPKRWDTGWRVFPNLWGVVVGTPGMQKTPAVSEGLKPVKRLQAETLKEYERQLENYEITQAIAKAQADGAKDKLKAAAKKPGATQEELRMLAIEARGGEAEKPPVWRRFIINDATPEKTGELLNENENGLLQERDELTGWLKTLNKQGHENERSLYLEAWNGSGSYTFDRIERGTVHIKNLCLSVFGTIQPGPLAKYLRAQGEEADGFIPRFQIMVYPDAPTEFKNVDRTPLPNARDAAYEVFQRFANFEPVAIGAHFDHDGGAFLHFMPDAQDAFNEWRMRLENRLHSGGDMPLMQTHLSKFRSLVPSLALVFHLAEGCSGDVCIEALNLAIRWAEYLESHAARVYQSAMDADTEAAQHLAERIRKSIPNPFKPRDIVKKGLKGLDTSEAMEKALGILEDRGWVQVVETAPGERGGRPSTLVYINPNILGEVQ